MNAPTSTSVINRRQNIYTLAEDAIWLDAADTLQVLMLEGRCVNRNL